MPQVTPTTLGNVEERFRRIQTSKLPRTSRDPFEITRQLGIRYLRVDALCIVQNDPKDWAIEAAKVDSKYSLGLVNIAVELGIDCTAGILQYAPEHEDYCIDL